MKNDKKDINNKFSDLIYDNDTDKYDNLIFQRKTK
jgi:hypothetical protein